MMKEAFHAAEPDDVNIRFSVLQDIQQLMELDHLIWDEKVTPASFRRWISQEEYMAHRPVGTQLVAVKGNIVCGYLGLQSPTPLPSNSHVSELDIGVHPAFQRRGIGRKLLDTAAAVAYGQGKRKLSLRVLSTNEEAILFYKRCGFTEQGRLVQEFYLGGRYVDDLLMYRLLD